VLIIKPLHNLIFRVGVFKLQVIHVVLCFALLAWTELLQGPANDLLIKFIEVTIRESWLHVAVTLIKVSTNNF
jgi:hypothetical protein